MALPDDFNSALWFSPLTFQGILGRAVAQGIYHELFRGDGFAKPKAELLADKRLAKIMPDADEIARDAKFTAWKDSQTPAPAPQPPARH